MNYLVRGRKIICLSLHTRKKSVFPYISNLGCVIAPTLNSQAVVPLELFLRISRQTKSLDREKFSNLSRLGAPQPATRLFFLSSRNLPLPGLPPSFKPLYFPPLSSFDFLPLSSTSSLYPLLPPSILDFLPLSSTSSLCQASTSSPPTTSLDHAASTYPSKSLFLNRVNSSYLKYSPSSPAHDDNNVMKYREEVTWPCLCRIPDSLPALTHILGIKH